MAAQQGAQAALNGFVTGVDASC